MKKLNYIDNAELYDSVISKSKIYGCGDRIFLKNIKKLCKNKTKIYEPGCGTGVITEKVAKIKGIDITGSDPSKGYISCAKNKLKRFKNIKFINKDSVFLKTEPVDIILMRFVYHHIKDKFKAKFIKRMDLNLKKGGKMIILDEFLPFYKNKEQWKKVLIEFHDKKSEIALKLKDKLTADIEQESKNLGLTKKGEYKVSLEIIKSHLKRAGFLNIKIILIHHPKLKNSKSLGMYLITADK